MEKEYLGKPNGIKSSLWVRPQAIKDFDNGKRKGKHGLIRYYQNQIKYNYIGINADGTLDAVYPKKLMEYHKSVIADLNKHKRRLI
jgi:hypothetical protein